MHITYRNTLWIQTLYTFPFTLIEAPLDVNTGASSLSQAQRILALDASSAPPPAPIKSSK